MGIFITIDYYCETVIYLSLEFIFPFIYIIEHMSLNLIACLSLRKYHYDI